MWRAADGTKDYVDMMAYDLSRLAVTGLMNKTAVSPSDIDYVLWGTVSQEIRTSNIARDVALGSGLPKSVTGHTVTQACISANQAICNGVQQIQTGRADVVIAGGVETFSDAAIRFSRAGMPRVSRKERSTASTCSSPHLSSSRWTLHRAAWTFLSPRSLS